MPKTTTYCPRCRQPVTVDVEQLFDVNTDPQAKQRLLNGQYNLVQCSNCGYTGNLATPLVYHDPNKELLLTYFPAELGLPVNEQEKLIGPLITRVMNNLPPEKRKAYLLRPQNMLTMQTMIEKILAADGITKEMLDNQQKKLNLLQRLLSTTQPESRAEIIKQEQALVDATFFAMLNRLVEATLAQGDQQSARQIASLQQELLLNSDYGRELQGQAKEAETAIRALQEASQKGLTREKLLDLIVAAPNEIQLSTLVSYARQGIDYEFFQILSKRIEAAKDDAERQKLSDLRETLLTMTRQIDEEMQRQVKEVQGFLEELLQQPDIEKATEENIEAINELFVEVLRAELQAARQKNDTERLAKLQKVVSVLERASAPPPEVAFIEQLLGAKDENERKQLLEQNNDKLTDQFMQVLASLAAQAEQQGQEPELVKQLQEVYRAVVRYKMTANLRQ